MLFYIVYFLLRLRCIHAELRLYSCCTSSSLACPVICGRRYRVERGSSVLEHRTRNQESPGSNPPLLPFRRLGIFVLSIDAPADSAV